MCATAPLGVAAQTPAAEELRAREAQRRDRQDVLSELLHGVDAVLTDIEKAIQA